MKISPLTNHRDTSKGAVVGGFDRTAFIQKCEKLFDKLFEYNRKVAETFDFQNAMKHGTVEEKVEQTERLVAENAEDLKESISAGINRRRKNLSNKRDADELAAMLEGGISLSASKEDTVKTALDNAEIMTVIMTHFSAETNATLLELHLIGEGITFKVIMAQDGGVEDLLFYKAGQKMKAKDIMSPQDHRMLLSHWQRLSDQIPAFILREQRTQAEREKEISQHKMGGPKMRR